jgi:hypothetical protein
MSNIFNENDYNSNDGMMTSIWGPALWHTLHTISFNYPVNPTVEQKENYYNFIIGLKNILPCGACRENFINNLKKLPLTMKDLKSRETFSKWVYNMHEMINKMLGKKSNLTYNQVRDRYEHFRSRCLIKPNKKNIESGCTESLYGIKSKCQINIIPKESKKQTFSIDKKCKITKLN